MSTLNGGPGNIVTNGLILYLDAANPLSYISGSLNWNDLTQGSTNMTSSNVLYNTEFNGSLRFNGSSSVLSTPAVSVSSSLSVTTGSFSIEHIFTPTSYQTSSYLGLTNMLTTKGPASTYNYAIQVTDSSSVSFIKRTNPENLRFHTFTVPIMTNKVNNVVFTIPAAGSVIKCYHNGTLVGSIAISGLPLAPAVADNIRIGAEINPLTYFSGSVYVVRMYNRELTSDEVLQNYNAQKSRFGL